MNRKDQQLIWEAYASPDNNLTEAEYTANASFENKLNRLKSLFLGEELPADLKDTNFEVLIPAGKRLTREDLEKIAKTYPNIIYPQDINPNIPRLFDKILGTKPGKDTVNISFSNKLKQLKNFFLGEVLTGDLKDNDFNVIIPSGKKLTEEDLEKIANIYPNIIYSMDTDPNIPRLFRKILGSK